MYPVENIDQQKGQSTSKTLIEKAANWVERVFSIFNKKEPEDLNDNMEKLLELHMPVRYKPIPVKKMAEETRFSLAEVKFLYQAFKQECPTGISSEETFKAVYQKIFPLGDSSKYAHLVFISIDTNKTGRITFGDFMEFLSFLARGSTLDKIMWSFQFYDVNRDGVISRDEMMTVSLIV